MTTYRFARLEDVDASAAQAAAQAAQDAQAAAEAAAAAAGNPRWSLEESSGFLQLTNDEASPAAWKVYGVDGSGVRGWRDPHVTVGQIEASGTPGPSTFLRGDGEWVTVPGDMLASVYDPNGHATDAFAFANMTGTVSIAQLGASGTPSNTTFLRGDGVWAPGGGGGGGSGDMSSAVYDPNGIAADAFDMDNMVEGTNTKIMTAAERTQLAGLTGSYQPLDSDLTAIAALTTTSFGRSFLDRADAAAGRTLLGLGTSAVIDTGTSGTKVPLLDGANTWSANQTLSGKLWQGGISAAAQGTNLSGFASSTAGASLVVENTSASGSGGGGGFLAYSNDGAAMASGDRLGFFLFGGSSSASSIRNTAGVAGFASQAWVDASAYGTRLEFLTTANGGTSRTTKLILGNSGLLVFGATEANSVPALKPSSAVLQVRLGDDSAFADIAVKGIAVNSGTLTGFTSGSSLLKGDGSGGFASATAGIEYRDRLTADRTYYVLTTGSNSNNGLANTAGGAWLTLQYAVDYVLDRLDLNGYNCTIQVGSGTYTTGVTILGKRPVGGLLKLKGDTTTPSNVVISVTGGQCIDLRRGTGMYIEGFKLSTTTSGNCLHISSQSYLGITGNMEFGACAGIHITADHESCIGISASAYSITGGATTHWNANNNSDIEVVQGPPAITITGTPTFTQFYAYDRGGGIENDATFTGSITGLQGSQGATGWIRSSTTIPGSGVSYADRTVGNVFMPTIGKQLVIGAAASQSISAVTPANQTHGDSTNAAAAAVYRWSNDTGPARNFLVKSRGAAIGTNTIVQSGDTLSEWITYGANGTGFNPASSVRTTSDGTPGASNDMPAKLELMVTADGSGALGTGLTVRQNKAIEFPSISTTASAANAFLDSAANNNLLRSTSSLRYKTDVEPIEYARAEAFLLRAKPIWYHSRASADKLESGDAKSFYSFGAEDLAAIDPRLVYWGYHDDDYEVTVEDDTEVRTLRPDAKPSPMGRDDGAIIAFLTTLVQDLAARVAKLEAKKK